jgi:A/G-specific adenine glycosylase
VNVNRNDNDWNDNWWFAGLRNSLHFSSHFWEEFCFAWYNQSKPYFRMFARGKKILFFETIIADFHRKAGREHLPWRRKGIGAYGIWVSEIMLQQTQVGRVISYYENFLSRFPDVESLAKTTWEEFLPYYQGLGYYARGRNMLRAAKVVVSEYGGKFPEGVKELEKLPGVGPYTAAAIASFAYGKDTIAWDTNLRRVVGRFFFGSKHVSFRASPRVEESAAKTSRSLDCARDDKPKKEQPGMTIRGLESSFSLPAKILNAAMMDFGSAICAARPKCGTCPLSERCIYFKEQGKSEQRAVNDDRKKNLQSAIDNLQSVGWKDARVFVILHENHKKYYSPHKTKFSPFVVPASHNTRAGIKDWFRRKYGLELSVRPPHKKELIDGKPTLIVNAQILSGAPAFRIFSKDEITDYR